MGSFQDFLTALGIRESRGNYREVNGLGFTGKYQFGEAILIDTGYYQAGCYYNGGGNGITTCRWEGTWTNKARQYGVNSYQQFKNNEGNIQEAAIRDEFNFNMRQIVNSARSEGYSLQGRLDQLGYTHSGILAAAHLQGAWGAIGLLKNGADRCDEYGTRMTEYARIFSGYQVHPNDIGGIQFLNM